MKLDAQSIFVWIVFGTTHTVIVNFGCYDNDYNNLINLKLFILGRTYAYRNQASKTSLLDI